MAKTLVAHEESLSRIFSDDYVFRIPGYQRPYAWTREQARELIDDLLDFMAANEGDVAEMPPYFLGSIVLIKQESQPDADVVDGQQRLTTLTLLLAAIRSTVSPENASHITPLLYERGNPIKGTQDRFRLQLRERDRDFFQKYVQRESGFDRLLKLNDKLPDSQENIRSNAKLYAERLSSIDESLRLRLAQFIVTRCFLVSVATPDLDAAYRIFSVLNSRGLDLSATDILKAEIIGAIPEGKRAAYTRKWEDAEEDLGREEFSELFSHIRMIYRRAKPKGTLLKEFKEHVDDARDPVRFIDNILLPISEAYEEVSDAAYSSTERAEAVNESLRWLNRLEFKDWMPPALAFAVRFRNDPALMERFFAGLERLAYSMLVRKSGINERIDRFSSLSQWIVESKNPFDAKSPLQLSPAEQFGTYEALNGPLYETLAARARTAILLRLDALLSGGGATYEYTTVSVEHVLPQNPVSPSKWIDWFGETRDRAYWTHRIANLVLLTRKKNSSASNLDFEKKKDAYFARGGVSPFAITTQVIHCQEWTAAVLEARQEELMTILEKHWELQDRRDPFAELMKGLE